MPRFQLVFREAGRSERSETRDDNMHGEPHINGKPIVNGETYTIHGSSWVVQRDDRVDGMERFTCIPAPEP